MTITIHGANDAAVISGATSGAVTEAGGVANGTPGMPTATGDLNSDRCRQPERRLAGGRPATASTNGYGTYALTAAGVVDLHARRQQCRRCRRSTAAPR